MRLAGMMLARNEAHEIGLSLRVAAQWCDIVVVLVHASTDHTADLVEEVACQFPGRVAMVHQDRESWDEMTDRQYMLDVARREGATHCAIIDADEILTWNMLGLVRGHVAHMPAGHIMTLPGYNLRHGIGQYHHNGIWSRRFFSVAFRDRPDLHWTGATFHHREPFTAGQPLKPWCITPHGKGGIMHLWGANERRLIAKHRAYRIMEALQWPNKSHADIERMYSLATKGDDRVPASEWTFAPVPPTWWQTYHDWVRDYLDLEMPPWQEAWCNKMIERHGIERFAGLDVRPTGGIAVQGA